jgi:hypothetical protein
MKTQKILMRTFCAFMALTAIIIALCETGVLDEGPLAGTNESSEFVVLSAMELLTICIIPVALRLFKFRIVARSLVTSRGLLHYGMLRLLMLCVPMLINIVLYYLYMNVAFGYMGIILFLCMAFVVPTKGRCEAEFRSENNQQKTPDQH